MAFLRKILTVTHVDRIKPVLVEFGPFITEKGKRIRIISEEGEGYKRGQGSK